MPPLLPFRISASLLSADFARIGEEVQKAAQAKVDMIHFDIMDNHYVPNLTFGPLLVEALRPYTSLPFDVHLMARPVDQLIAPCAAAGAQLVSFHPEASDHPHRTITLIRDHGMQAGVVLNPATPVHWLDFILEEIGMVVIMTVNPGFPGQSFLRQSLPKIKRVREMIGALGRPISLSVDGGVNRENIALLARAGADTFVAGSAVFRQGDCGQAVEALRRCLAEDS